MRRGFSTKGDVIGDRVRFADYLRRLDAQAVLDHYGAENATTQTNTDGTVEVVHSCLLDRVESHHANGDQHPSAACNLDKKLYVCYSYWGGDLLHLIMKLEGKETVEEILPMLGDFLGESVPERENMVNEIDRLISEHSAPVRAVPVSASYSERILRAWAYHHPYVESRGIDLATASRMHIGYDKTENRITIPHFWKGNLVGWQKRAIPITADGDWPATYPPQPKYRSSSGFPKSTTLYNGDNAHPRQGDVIVVESPFSVIKAEALGIPNVVATFGAKVTTDQLDLIAFQASQSRVIVWMDADEAGEHAEARIARSMWERDRRSTRIVAADHGMDLGDYDDADLIQAKLDAAVPLLDWVRRTDEEKKPWARPRSPQGPSRTGTRSVTTRTGPR